MGKNDLSQEDLAKAIEEAKQATATATKAAEDLKVATDAANKAADSANATVPVGTAAKTVKYAVKVNDECGEKFGADHIEDGSTIKLPYKTALKLIVKGFVTEVEPSELSRNAVLQKKALEKAKAAKARKRKPTTARQHAVVN